MKEYKIKNGKAIIIPKSGTVPVIFGEFSYERDLIIFTLKIKVEHEKFYFSLKNALGHCTRYKFKESTNTNKQSIILNSDLAITDKKHYLEFYFAFEGKAEKTEFTLSFNVPTTHINKIDDQYKIRFKGFHEEFDPNNYSIKQDETEEGIIIFEPPH